MKDSAQEKKKAIKMIIIGFAGPIVLIFAGLILSSALNFVQKAIGGDVGVITIVSNIILLLIGVVGVVGLFSWGPIIGIIGLTKLNKSKEASANPSQAIESQDETSPNNLNNKE